MVVIFIWLSHFSEYGVYKINSIMATKAIPNVENTSKKKLILMEIDVLKKKCHLLDKEAVANGDY